MIKIAIAGIKGRMGTSIYNCLSGNKNMTLSNATTMLGDKDIGKKTSDILLGSSEIILSENLTNDFDVLIDFTTIESTFANLEFCKNNNKAIVIGTTGFSNEEVLDIELYAKSIPVFLSGNMSLGVNVMQQLVAQAARSLQSKADIEIVETHHKHKIDAPSGTAMMIGRTIADEIGIDLTEKGVFARDGIIGERESGSIGFSTIRGGDVVGEHSVYYYMAGERVEITHRATDRSIFARGALFATEFLANQKVGIYNMFDALDSTKQH